MKRLSNSKLKLIEKQLNDLKASLESTNSATNTELVKEYYQSGGKAFVEAVERYGYTERGKKVSLSNWFREHLEFIGDLRVHDIFISGCAQVGKSLSCSLLQTFCLVELQLNILGVFDKNKTMERNTTLQFIPIATKWIKEKGEKADKVSTSLFRFKGANGIFSYVSTSKSTSQREGLASAGSAVVSVTADILFTDERSQFPPGTADPLPRRLDASQLPSKPTRNFGTPGAGAGIEKQIANCTYQFYPHVICEHCQQSTSLHPLGALLRPVDKVVNGKSTKAYFSESGRPLKWFHSDPYDPVRSAFIGCIHCEHPISDEARKNAYFQCLKTGVLLRDFLDNLNQR